MAESVSFLVIVGVFVLFLMALLAIVFSILAFIRATAGIAGPAGPQGNPGATGPAGIINVPPFFVSSDTFTITSSTTSFLVFTANPAGPSPILVSLPPASTVPGFQFQLYTPSAAAGILLLPVGTDAPIALFNPIPVNRLAFLTSDGVTQWVLNI